MWVLLALIGAFGSATGDAIGKRLLGGNINILFLGGAQFLLSGLLLSIVVFYVGIPVLSASFWWAVLATVLINVAAQYLTFQALKIADISVISPMIAFTPVFLILTAFVMLHELPSLRGAVGILLVVIGSYVLNTAFFTEPFAEVWKRFRHSRAVLYMLGVAFLFSISSVFDKVASLTSSPLFASAAIHVLLGLCFFILLYAFSHTSIGTGTLRVKTFAPWLFLLGSVTAVSAWASNTALTMEIVPYVISVKRTSMLFAVLYGALLFKEVQIPSRFLGASIMLVGVVLIAFS